MWDEQGSAGPGLALLLGTPGAGVSAMQLCQPCGAASAPSSPCAHQGAFPAAGGVSAGEGSPAAGPGGGCLLQTGGWTAGPLAHLSEQTQRE